MAGYKGNVYTNDMGSQELYEIPVAKTVTDKVAKKPEGSSENGKLNLAKWMVSAEPVLLGRTSARIFSF